MADPGFPAGVGDPTRWGGGGGGGRRTPTQALFGENVCENERIGSHEGGGRQRHPLDPPKAFFLQKN